MAATLALGPSHALGRATSASDVEFARVVGRASRFPGFLGLREISSRTNRLLARFPGLFTRQSIGRSRAGRPIDLVTLTAGERSALVVAGIHANEPVGSLVADLMMHELAENDALRRRLNMTWQFINPVDPDGMDLNAGWLTGAPTPQNYLRHFFRPALARQPDYSFPLRVGEYVFAAQSPENLAFQAALDAARPDLLFPLHNCEFGGAFCVLSRTAPALEHRFRALADEFGTPVSSVGEPFADLTPFSRGVFETPRPHELIRGALEAGIADPQSIWPAGGSSTEYADRYGVFSLTVETPLWRSRHVPTTQWPLGRVIDEQVDQLRKILPLMEQLTPSVPNSELAHACVEYLAMQRRQISRLPEIASAAGSVPLSAADTASLRIQLSLFGLRGPATLARVLADPSRRTDSRGSEALRSVIRSGLKGISSIAPLEASSLTAMVALQALACFGAAEFGDL